MSIYNVLNSSAYIFFLPSVFHVGMYASADAEHLKFLLRQLSVLLILQNDASQWRWENQLNL